MKELRDQLWDFVYGLLDEADTVSLREQITSDRHVAREYARVKLQSELLAQAARAAPSEQELPVLPERRATKGRSTSRARMIVFGGSLALALGLLLFAGVMYWSDGTTLRGPAVAQALDDFEKDKHPRLIVTGPQVLEPEATNTYDITVQSLNGESLNAPVVTSLEDLNGNQLWYELSRTGLDGKHTVELPADKLQHEGVRLKIAVAPDDDGAGANTVANGPPLITWLPVQKQGGELSVINQLSDGERVYFREAEIRLLDRADSDDDLDIRAESSRDDKLQRFKKSRSNPDNPLTEDAKRVRWGTERFAQIGVNSEKSLSPAEEGKQKPSDIDSQHSEALPGRSPPVHAPMPTGKPGNDIRQDLNNDAPAPEPRDPRPQPTAPPQPALDAKTETSHDRLGAVSDSPAAVPSASSTQQPEAILFEDEVLESTQADALLGKKILLESITANEKLISSRVVDGTQGIPSLEQRIEDLRKERKLDAKFFGRINGIWYDATVAPPQKVMESKLDVPLDVQPLACTIQFDRLEYRVGDVVGAELQVTDGAGQGLPAVINVQVDALPLLQSDAEVQQLPRFQFTSVESPPVPLVFDNVVQQGQSYRLSLARERSRQRQAQRHTALLLLGGSATGVAMLLVAGLMKWLPRARYWLPVAALFGCCGVLGAAWLPGDESPLPPPVSPAIPLTTYGVQSTPLAGKKTTTGAEFRSELRSPRLEDELLALDEVQLPEIEMPEAEVEPNRSPQNLIAMSDWERLAKSVEDRMPNANESAESIAVTMEPLGIGLGDFTERVSTLGAESLSGSDSADGVRTSPAQQTVYWHPRLLTDATGKCRIQFPAPAGPLAHRVTVIAHGGGRLGIASEPIPSVVAVPRP